MKILIIGNGKSIYIQNYIKYVLLGGDNKVYLSFHNDYNDELLAIYQSLGVELVDLFEKRGPFRQIPKISTLSSFIMNLNAKIKPLDFDIIHIQGMYDSNLLGFAYKSIRKCCKRLVLSYWGSDILDIDNKKAKKMRNLLNAASVIHIATESMRKAFRGYYGKQYDKKLASAFFGNVLVQRYTELSGSGTLSSLENPIYLPEDKYIIALGYNGNKRQQHKEIITSLASLPKQILKKCYFVIQMSYGIDSDNYMTVIMNILKDNNMEGVVFDKFLSVDESIALKSKVDIFVHGQTTDAHSSSLLEYMYLGSKVISPSWIEYEEWKELGIKYWEYDSFSDLPRLFEFLLDYDFDAQNNYEIIKKEYSWESKKQDWINMLTDQHFN